MEGTAESRFGGAGLGEDLASLGDSMADVVVVIDADGRIQWANRAAATMTGERLEDWLDRPGFELVHPDDLQFAALSLQSVQEKDAGTPIELRMRSAGGWRLMEVLGSKHGDEHIVLVMRDLTDRRRWEIAGDDVARFRALVHNAAGLTVLLGCDGTVLSASAALTRQLGHDPEVVTGRAFAELVNESDRPVLEAALQQAIVSGEGDSAAVAEVRLCSRLGIDVPFELSIVSLLRDPTVEGLVVSGHDITRLRMAQDALTQLANHDSLTGLLNRRSFDQALEREWKLTSRDQVDSYVVVLDLDGFKELNDRFGHAAGDDALRQVGRTLQAVARSTDVLGRLGGDEFGILLVRCGGEAAAVAFDARLHEALAGQTWPFEATVSATLGYQSLQHAASPAEALQSADLAMLANKPHRGR